MPNFKPIDDNAIEVDYATDAAVLGRICTNQRAVWEDLGDTVIQQMDRVARGSWEWVMVWAAPWYWFPGDKTLSAALLCDGLVDSDANCNVELCLVFSELGQEPVFDVGVTAFAVGAEADILEVESPEYRFDTTRFGFVQLWMRCPDEPTSSEDGTPFESSEDGDVDLTRWQIRDSDALVDTYFSGAEVQQLVLALIGYDEGSSSVELLRAHVCKHETMTFWGANTSPPTNRDAFFIDKEPLRGQRLTVRLWQYAAVRPHNIGVRINRHAERGWFTARPDQVQTGQTQTQIAFVSLAEGDRALYGMKRPWALWYDTDQGGGVNAPGIEEIDNTRLYPGPRHADRLRHRMIALVLAWDRFTMDSSTIPVTLRAEMAEPDEDTSITLYTTWAGESELQVPSFGDYSRYMSGIISGGSLPGRLWNKILEYSSVVSVVYGRDPGDPGSALGTSTAPYMHRISARATRFRSRSRILFGSIWSEEV